MGGRKGKRLPRKQHTPNDKRKKEAERAVKRIVGYCNRGMSYSELARITNTAVSSIRRWALRKVLPGYSVAVGINETLDRFERDVRKTADGLK